MSKFALAAFTATGLALLASAKTAVSTNAYAIAEFTCSSTNTIICVPWTGYTSDGKPTLDLLVNRLVSPRNLTTGDLVIKLDGADYLAWSLEDVAGSTTGEREWQAINTVSSEIIDSLTKSELNENTDTGTEKCGLGVWLIRQDPTKSFYLNGQWTKSYAPIQVAQGSAEANALTMLANPNNAETKVNDLTWSGVAAGDVIILTTDSSMTHYCQWDATKSQWYYTAKEKVVKGKITTTKTVAHYDLTVPAGVGFWYRSAGGQPTVNWSDLDKTE